MTNDSRQKLLVITVFLTMLLVSSVSASLMPSVHAAEMTVQQKGLSILSNVVGLDLAKYDVPAKEYQPDLQASYLGVVPQKCVGYELTSGESKLKLLYTFANGRLQMIQVLEKEDAPSLTKPPIRFNILAAKNFLSNYQKYTADPLYGELRSALDNVDASKNLTKTSGNTVLEVTANDGFTNFKWYYTCNGAIAPYSKFIALGVKDGFLSAFVDNWQLYDVGGTSVNLSKEEAIAIALETAKAHSWSVKLDDDTLEAKNFNESNVRWTALVFDCSLRAEKTRSADLLRLYPVWRVGIALNKWYGYMYGIQVDVWADTKEVRSVQEAWSILPPSEDAPTSNVRSQASVSGVNSNLTMLITLPTVAASTIGTAIVWMSRKKKLHYAALLKPRSLKTGGMLLCILLSSMILLAPIATVNATTRAAQVWGSESTGAINPSTGLSWRKSPNEIYQQRLAAANISAWFAANGYVGYNYQGNYGSWKSNILNNIDWMSDYYDRVAVVAFDHGVGGYPGTCPGYQAPPNEFHYMFEDNYGTYRGETYPGIGPNQDPSLLQHGVFDMDIYPLTHPGKIVFAFISTCMSANTTGQGLIDGVRARGLPFAFTHGRYVVDKSSTPGFTIVNHMSDDGYDDPDWGSQVYIGFPYGSASLTQGIPFGGGGGNPYYYWVYSFFYHALYYDMSVNQALDSASWHFMGSSFRFSPLRTGFDAIWPFDKNGNGYYYDEGELQIGYGSTLAVYGNGNIRLKQFTPPSDAASTPSVGGPIAGDIGVSYEFSAFATDPYGHSVQYRFDWGDGSPYTETGWYSDGATAYASHSWSSGGLYSVRVQARCPNSGWSSWSSPRVIIIGNYYWLTVYAVDEYSGYPLYPSIFIDGNLVGYGYASVPVMAGWHTVFVDEWVNNPHFGCQSYLAYFTDGYGNGASRPVYSNTEITAVYYQYW